MLTAFFLSYHNALKIAITQGGGRKPLRSALLKYWMDRGVHKVVRFFLAAEKIPSALPKGEPGYAAASDTVFK